MIKKIFRWLTSRGFSYVVFFVTSRCNADCRMCFYKERMDSHKASEELTLEEYEKIAGHLGRFNILGISGGEPFIRQDLAQIVKTIYQRCSPLVLDIPTNGYFVESVVRQVEDIARSCPGLTVDLQLSIDGPEEIHDSIRQLPGSFEKVRETYQQLVPLKARYPNLKLKACVVYSHYNQDHMEKLFDLLKKYFSRLDRVVFSVVHGSVNNPEAMDFDWEKYFRICEHIRSRTTVERWWDFHGLFTQSLRIVKNDYLREVLRKKDMFRRCRAGRRVIVINERGEVFPCEPLWQAVGELRKSHYDLRAVVRSQAMKDFQKQIKSRRCQCHWGLPMSNAIIFSPRHYPRLIGEMIRILTRSFGKRSKESSHYGF